MYEHPYFSRQITQFEQEQRDRATALRVFLREHPGQVAPVPEGAVLRMLRRVFRRFRVGPAAAAGAVGDAKPEASRLTARAVSACDAAAAPAR